MMRSRFAFACVLGLAAFGCRKPSDAGAPVLETGSFDRAALLDALGACASTTVKGFGDSAQKLAVTTAALATDPSAANKKAARDAYLVAADAWQQAELMQFGPLGPTTSPGGAGLRDNFYAWPLLGRCQTDRAVALESYKAADFGKTSLPTVRGLGALEYLLFFEGETNGCGSSEDINAMGTWAAIPKDQLALRRAAYADVLAKDLVARSQEVASQYDTTFLPAFKAAGKGSAMFATFESALNTVTDAMFYVYFMSRDRKVGAPLGLDVALCPEGPCGDLLESPWAKHDVKNLRANLVAFRKLFEGCGSDYSGVAFDDLLVAVGAGTLATEMKTDLANALAVVDAYPYATLEEGLAKDVPAVQKVYDALKRITDLLKVDFTGVLKLQVPARVGGDAD